MARKVIIDCDPGIDDAVALCLALFDPRLEVVAITAVEGSVPAEQVNRNVQAIVEQLDPPRFPRTGAASPMAGAPDVDSRPMHGSDGLGNSGFVVSQLQHKHPSEKLLSDEIRADDDEITIITLGPLTNIARAFRRDPELPSLIHRMIIAGGSVVGVGDITAAAEFNMYYDPLAAREVFRSVVTKTLVPLDVTRKVTLDFDLVSKLPGESTRAGRFLRKIIPFAFRAHHQQMGQESIELHDAIALIAALHPELIETTELDGDVEISGELTRGVTVFDRRPNVSPRSGMEVVTGIDVAAARDCIVRGLQAAGECT